MARVRDQRSVPPLVVAEDRRRLRAHERACPVRRDRHPVVRRPPADGFHFPRAGLGRPDRCGRRPGVPRRTGAGRRTGAPTGRRRGGGRGGRARVRRADVRWRVPRAASVAGVGRRPSPSRSGARARASARRRVWRRGGGRPRSRARRPRGRCVDRPSSRGAARGGFAAFWLGLAFAFVGFLVVVAVENGPTSAYARFVGGSGEGGAVLVVHHALVLPNQSAMILATSMGSPTTLVVADEAEVDMTLRGIEPGNESGASLMHLVRPTPKGQETLRFPSWFWLFLVVPAAATILGGRHAAAGVRRRTEAIARGALGGLVYAAFVPADRARPLQPLRGHRRQPELRACAPRCQRRRDRLQQPPHPNGDPRLCEGRQWRPVRDSPLRGGDAGGARRDGRRVCANIGRGLTG